MKREQRVLLDAINYDRKPSSVGEIGSDVASDSTALEGLLELDTKQLTGDGEVLSNFLVEVPMYFILVRTTLAGRERFLVCTEGYDYPRYITRIREVEPRPARLRDLTTRFGQFCQDSLAEGHGAESDDLTFLKMALEAFVTVEEEHFVLPKKALK